MPVSEIETEKAFDNQIKPSLDLRAKQVSPRAIASSLPGARWTISESRYWVEKYGLGQLSLTGKPATFAHPRKAKLKASSAAVIHCLDFGPPAFSHVSPLAVASGPRVRLYGTDPHSSFHQALLDHSTGGKELETIEADRQLQTGGSLALSVSYRHDGRLLAVATESGQVRVIDATSRATLRTFQAPTNLAIRSVQWFRDGQTILAAGDDGVARVWSMSDDVVKMELRGHGDSIRSAQLWQKPRILQAKWPSLAFTGSHDHTIRIWRVEDLDGDDDRCLAVLSHDAPVEVLLILKSSNPDLPFWLLSAGGTHIKVWNPLTGVCVCKSLSRHRKTITSMVAVPKKNDDLGEVQIRVITGGLDALLRFYSWNSTSGALEHVHGVSMVAPITALAFSEPQNRMAIGTVEGTVLIRQRGPSLKSKKRTREPKAGTYAFFNRGMNTIPSAGDYVAEDGRYKKKKLKLYDVSLKQFRYGDALDEVLATRNPVEVVAVLEELGRRCGLTTALSNRDEGTLEPLLSFTTKYIGKHRYTCILMGVANRLVDIYGSLAGQSEVVDDLFRKLNEQVSEELRNQKLMLRLAGELDIVINSIGMNMENND